MSDKNLQFARGGAEFTVELFERLNSATPKKNIIVSPFSIQACLALAFAGAKGATADEIAKALKYVSNCTKEVAATFQHVLEQYQSSELLKIANKLYVQEGKPIRPEFANVTKEQYHAAAETVNFANSSAAVQNINQWVQDKTAGKIKSLISQDDIGCDTRLVLLNAIHFKGDWQNKFDVAQTEEHDFWVAKDQSLKAKYMNQKANFGYGFFDEYKCTALEMPYKDSDLSMFVLLPNERDGLKALGDKLKNVNLLDLSKQMSVREVMVKFPKFKIDYSIELKNVLAEMGITTAFSTSADFSNMLESTEPISISNVFHKASIEVNEEGSEAAAATGAICMERCIRIPMEFVADHPFFYWIWNKKNILFAGAFLTAPTEE